MFARTLRHRLGGLVEDGEKHPPGLRGQRVDEGARRRRAGHACRALCARPEPERELLELCLPGRTRHRARARARGRRRAHGACVAGGPIEFERVAPASGNPVGRRQAVLAPARPGRGRDDGALLGQRRRHPPHGRRRPPQDPALHLSTPDLDRLHRDGATAAGPPPRPATEPVTTQRRASATGVIVVCGQRVALGRINAHRTLPIHVSETTLAIELDDQEVQTVRRTTTKPLRNIKSSRTLRTSVLWATVNDQLRQNLQVSAGTRHRCHVQRAWMVLPCTRSMCWPVRSGWPHRTHTRVQAGPASTCSSASAMGDAVGGRLVSSRRGGDIGTAITGSASQPPG